VIRVPLFAFLQGRNAEEIRAKKLRVDGLNGNEERLVEQRECHHRMGRATAAALW
jgi:hypothetical protein